LNDEVEQKLKVQHLKKNKEHAIEKRHDKNSKCATDALNPIIFFLSKKTNFSQFSF
jgi:hypothetical protein